MSARMYRDGSVTRCDTLQRRWTCRSCGVQHHVRVLSVVDKAAISCPTGNDGSSRKPTHRGFRYQIFAKPQALFRCLP